jgi:hypothetical protein
LSYGIAFHGSWVPLRTASLDIVSIIIEYYEASVSTIPKEQGVLGVLLDLDTIFIVDCIHDNVVRTSDVVLLGAVCRRDLEQN